MQILKISLIILTFSLLGNTSSAQIKVGTYYYENSEIFVDIKASEEDLGSVGIEYKKTRESSYCTFEPTIMIDEYTNYKCMNELCYFSFYFEGKNLIFTELECNGKPEKKYTLVPTSKK